jgi:hypothetical protein
MTSASAITAKNPAVPIALACHGSERTREPREPVPLFAPPLNQLGP